MNFINKITIPEEVTAVIRTYIDDFESSKRRQKMSYGEDYYRSENTEIMNRRMLIYSEVEDSEGNKIPIEMEDPYKANNKLPAGYFKLLVDQKINYILGKEITFETEQAEELQEVLGKKFQSTLKQVGRESAKKVIGWLHPYIDENGEFKQMVVPSEQVVPVYKPHDNKELELIIRYYSVTVLNERSEAVRVTRVEVWDDQEVTYYQENKKTNLFDLLPSDRMEEIFGRPYPNPKYHFQKDVRYGQSVARTEGQAWGMIPFIPLYNNDEEEYDLQPVKPFIDAYDVVNSDFVNNLEDFQDVYWILKGYDGENLSEFLHQVKRYKTLKVSDDGDAKSEKIDVPYEARKEAKEGLEKDIFNFGMGVNPNAIGDGNITNVVIRSRYANLDLKASSFELELKDFINKLLDFVNRYREITNQPPIEVEDIVFNRSVIFNEVELLEANREQMGVVSEDTRLSNHPWVSDIEAEKEDMEAEQVVDLDNYGGGDNEPVE